MDGGKDGVGILFQILAFSSSYGFPRLRGLLGVVRQGFQIKWVIPVFAGVRVYGLVVTCRSKGLFPFAGVDWSKTDRGSSGEGIIPVPGVALVDDRLDF